MSQIPIIVASIKYFKCENVLIVAMHWSILIEQLSDYLEHTVENRSIHMYIYVWLIGFCVLGCILKSNNKHLIVINFWS